MADIEIIMEGDSWERLPDFGPKALPIVAGSSRDPARGLADFGFRVHNLAYWGDTIADIVSCKDYVAGLRQTGARALVLGGGGNDLLGGGRLATYLRLYDRDLAVEDDLKPQFEIDLDKVMLDDEIAGTPVFVHGYDHARPMELGRLGEPMTPMGIDPPKDALRAGIVEVTIDRFDNRPKRLEAQWDDLHDVDFRSMVGDRRHDELHPEKAACEDLAGDMAKKIRRVLEHRHPAIPREQGGLPWIRKNSPASR